MIHLAGDLEQPLHAGERSGDQGGNKPHVVLHAKRSDGTSYTKASTFHSMWDDSLVDLQAYSWGSYADALDADPLLTVEAAPYDEVRIAARANGLPSDEATPPGKGANANIVWARGTASAGTVSEISKHQLRLPARRLCHRDRRAPRPA
ncbi:S1/P1 nuclease [Bradyrhizobium sp. 1.29L]